MNALIINASPVRDGATAEIVRVAADALRSRFDVRALCIDDFAIGMCRGCRSCHRTGACVQSDGAQVLMAAFEAADAIVCVSPAYWMDVPAQFKAFIDRCTPWCDAHEPHAALSPGKSGYVIALRTGPGPRDCQRVIETVEHFYGHLGIARAGRLALTGIEGRADIAPRVPDILEFCETVQGG